MASDLEINVTSHHFSYRFIANVMVRPQNKIVPLITTLTPPLTGHTFLSLKSNSTMLKTSPVAENLLTLKSPSVNVI